MVDTVRQSTVVRLPHARSPLDITEAKLLRPPRRLGTVNRPALVDRLIDSRTIPLIAIVAPAGYGKTTLLSDWAERDERPFAWVSVDEGDVDPVVFLSHVAMALDRVEPLEAGVFRAIASPGAANPGRAVRRLGAAISRSTRRFVLVLNELDRAHEQLCLDAVTSLAMHLPEGSAIAITARTVPEVGLPRFRADGRLLEIGVDDLALDAVAARHLLRGAGFLATKSEAQELTDATEGWPVGLYLAALSHQQQQRSGVVPPIRFSGEDRFIVDYVRSEVLKPLSRERQRFLTRTSILERLSGPLCDAILQRSGSATNPGVDRARQPPRRPTRSRAAVVPVPIAVPRRPDRRVAPARARHGARAVPQSRGLVRVDRPARGGDETRACRRGPETNGRAAPASAPFGVSGRADRHDAGLVRPTRRCGRARSGSRDRVGLGVRADGRPRGGGPLAGHLGRDRARRDRPCTGPHRWAPRWRSSGRS